MAARFFVGGGSSANWSATAPTNWSATSGGSNNATVPALTDDVTFDGAGATGNTAVTVTNANALSLTFTSGYTATATLGAGITVTIAGNFTDNTAHGWSGSTGTFTINAASTITSGGKTFSGNVVFSGASTKTLSGDWTILGDLTQNSGAQVVNSNNLNIGGSLSPVTAGFSGTTKFVMNGTGNIGRSNATISNNVDINTSGTITFATNFDYSTGTLKYVAGTIANAGLLRIQGASTLDLAGATILSVTFNTSGTVTLSSLLTATTITFNNNNVTLAGTAGFTCTTFLSNQVGLTTTLQNSITYTIISSFAAIASAANSSTTYTSNDGTLRANLILLNDSSTCNVAANFTRINAAGGRPINTFNGTITDCINVASYSNVLFKPVTTFNRGSRRFRLWDVNRRVIYE